ncbi:MAG: 30S ribosomal protein S9 [Anaerolineales bacterium]|jgi:small subunit ribosomal protein S9|nr:30S ribosomal protein S9 [Anaerolineales bacterium]MCK4976375.1 30S ribosomal protein S9 [Anaerolineales bacterium]MCK5315979.1 30S ribosomal protein S9 [Anaerolineales bacterium]MCK5428025.1 30S ribosomal protein S9 [Anaerolineales bacterium]
MSVQYYEGIGRRKASTARVRIMAGSGNFIINGKPLEDYFTRLGDIEKIVSPLQAVGEDYSRLDISVMVKGGGVTGQTGSVQLGIARALLLMNPDLRSTLRKGGFTTRDPRVKERKKPGLKRARKAPTYTKR